MFLGHQQSGPLSIYSGIFNDRIRYLAENWLFLTCGFCCRNNEKNCKEYSSFLFTLINATL